MGFPGGSVRSPGEGNGNPLQYSCLKNSMDRGAWWATVHGVPKSRTRLSGFTHFTGGAVVKNLSANAGDTGDTSWICGSVRYLRVGNGNLLQYSCLKNSMDRRTLWATVLVVVKS